MKKISRVLELTFGLTGSITGVLISFLMMVSFGLKPFTEVSDIVMLLVVIGFLMSIVTVIFASLVFVIPMTTSIILIVASVIFFIYHMLMWFSASLMLAAGIIGIVRTVKYNKTEKLNSCNN